jgi:hypothetical protein
MSTGIPSRLQSQEVTHAIGKYRSSSPLGSSRQTGNPSSPLEAGQHRPRIIQRVADPDRGQACGSHRLVRNPSPQRGSRRLHLERPGRSSPCSAQPPAAFQEIWPEFFREPCGNGVFARILRSKWRSHLDSAAITHDGAHKVASRNCRRARTFLNLNGRGDAVDIMGDKPQWRERMRTADQTVRGKYYSRGGGAFLP